MLKLNFGKHIYEINFLFFYIIYSFGGVEFPPVIYFKIYVRNFNGALPKYVNGKTLINSDRNV